MALTPDINEQLQKVNELIPVHSMWDGFWIYDFEHGNLTITCSFDRTEYRNFDIEFKNVRFFNIPSEWRDTHIEGDKLFKPGDKEAFQKLYPETDVAEQAVFALDLTVKSNSNPSITHRFHIVAERVVASACLADDARPNAYFKDPFEKETFPCFKNRVL